MSKIIAVFLEFDSVDCWSVSADNLQKLAEDFPDYEVCGAATEDVFLELLQDAEIAVCWRFPDEWVERFPQVKIVATPAAGADLMPTVHKDKVRIIQSSFHGEIMSETAVGLVLAHSRQLFSGDYLMKHGESWPRPVLDKRMRMLGRSHVAVLGFGAIGMLTARRLKAFGCRITGIKRNLIPEPNFFTPEDSIVTIESFKDVLRDVDHLVSILPASESTNDIINKEVFDLLPDRAAVYNFGRGNAVNEVDLIDALKSAKIAAAYLDVFKSEPLPADSPLRKVKNLYLYPHSSAMAPEYLDLFFEELTDKIRKEGL